ncbi:alpha/beta hydrolase [Spirulina subsalsa FACHB-351]|uniref:Alpha/beta hydrolase n=1 Tax=Spirulina subsalsa FACHB-351 TaxID=234711 RepID=A0ABT3L2P6_9CYAN|nr:alpha/beta hydrolase [Spirulina subsalsa]MCW6035457.1 alpha/beta hydrolase [Spirulina subsalsa FACHB-351]
MLGSSSIYTHVRGEGFPVLCIHGHPGSGGAMSVFTDSLSQQCLTLAPDLRGYGRSRTGIPFTLSQHLQDLEALLDQRQIERCLLLGWSLGGILALELMLRSPQRYSGLILIGTAARPRGRHPKTTPFELLATGIAGLLNTWRPGWSWNIEQWGKRSLFRYLLQQHTTEAYGYLAREGTPAYYQTSPLAHQALRQALQSGYNRLPDLQKITVPCLMLAGSEDVHITPESSQETALALPNCEWHCYHHTAHLFPWEVPSALQTRLQEWLKAHPEVTQ